jgi:hypothetical protein
MPDISMCNGKGCPSANECYRFRATPNEYRQSYFMTPPIKDGKCDYFWSIEGYERLTPVSNEEPK